MSDLFVNPQTKAFFDNFERTRVSKNLPMQTMDIPWTQALRIHKFITEENNKRSQKDSNRKKLLALIEFVESKLQQGYSFKKRKETK